jgi:UDP-GlcNAc:undecaprenyl-phosphate/decaprenyl-phosphate GlcNAc-1-phosphate transferase
MGDMTPYAVIALATGMAVVALVPLVRRVAIGYGVTDRPAPGKLHRAPTPYMGGVAIVVAAFAASSFLPGWSAQAAVILGAAVMIAIAGLVDDMRTVSPRSRLAIEIAASLAAAAAGARVDITGGPIDWVLTVGWLVVITNSFNLLDNMDGAAGIIGTTTALGLVIAAGSQGQVLVGGLAALVLGACLGFLAYNWYPAKIFMGDAGSLFLGFLLAVIALKLRFPADRLGGIAAVVLLAGSALFDTTLVVISRLATGRKVYLGGTDHTSHRLLHLGVSVQTTAIVMAFGTASCVVLGLGVGRGALPAMPVLVAVLSVGALALTALLRVPIYGETTSRVIEPVPLAPAIAD